MAALLKPLLEAGVPRIMILVVLLLVWQKKNGPKASFPFLFCSSHTARVEHVASCMPTYDSWRAASCTWWSSSVVLESCTVPSHEMAEQPLGSTSACPRL